MTMTLTRTRRRPGRASEPPPALAPAARTHTSGSGGGSTSAKHPLGRRQPAGGAMPLLQAAGKQQPVHLVLARDQVRSLKSGHPWIYKSSLAALPVAPPGSLALVKTKEGDIIAKGFYDPKSQLVFRALAVRERRLDEELLEGRLAAALALRRRLFQDVDTTGFRLLNGEGDRLPGLVCDVYGTTAVLKLDGDAAAGFYDAAGIAAWLQQQLQLKCVFQKNRSGSDSRGQVLVGSLPKQPVRFTENGVQFAADVVAGQKTGFFLDQRDNRQRMQPFQRGMRVLNLFGYTGGFSVYAGLAGASSVTTVDIADGALAAADANWSLNGLPSQQHESVAADAFDFLERAAQQPGQRWDVVICDPPSFAPNKAAVERARASYERLFQKAAAVTKSGGILALASCSSHIDSQLFQQVCDAGIAKARRTAVVLGVHGQPADHPFPAACPELKYLKFHFYQLD